MKKNIVFKAILRSLVAYPDGMIPPTMRFEWQ
jgi:hypothetical protein